MNSTARLDKNTSDYNLTDFTWYYLDAYLFLAMLQDLVILIVNYKVKVEKFEWTKEWDASEKQCADTERLRTRYLAQLFENKKKKNSTGERVNDDDNNNKRINTRRICWHNSERERKNWEKKRKIKTSRSLCDSI